MRGWQGGVPGTGVPLWAGSGSWRCSTTTWLRRWGGRGQVVGLVGEPGMGKTRLLTEFCRRVPGDQVTVYEGQCLSYGQATPYLLVRDLLRQVCGLVEGDTSGSPHGRRPAAAAREWHDGGGRRGPAAPAPGPPGAPEALAQRSPEARQARTFALLRHLLLDAAQQQPLVLVVENLHWSRSHLGRLAGVAGGAGGRGRRVAPGDLSAGLSARLGGARRGDAGRRAALAHRGQPDRRPGGAGHRVPPGGAAPGDRGAGGGQSLLFGGVGLACRGTGRAGHTGGGAGDGARRAGGPHGPVAARGEAPPPDGCGHWPGGARCRCCRALAEVPEEALHRGLAHLQTAEFLYETRLFPEHAYTFKHALTQEVAYSSLLQERRRDTACPPCRGS